MLDRISVPPTLSGADSRRPLRILSMDGGGSKGLNVIEVLLMLEARTSLPISDTFDMICGTSIGGATALAINRRTVDGTSAMLAALEDLPKSVWAHASHWCLLVKRQKVPQEKVDDWFTNYVVPITAAATLESKLAPPHEAPVHGGGRNPHCFMVSATQDVESNLQPFLIGNYTRTRRHRFQGANSCAEDSSWTVRDVARATSAAPTYFAPFVKDGTPYLDGALAANNPTMFAIVEAQATWPGRPIGTIVSLGTGRFTKTESISGAGAGITYWVSQMMELALSSTKTHQVTPSVPRGPSGAFNPDRHLSWQALPCDALRYALRSLCRTSRLSSRAVYWATTSRISASTHRW